MKLIVKHEKFLHDNLVKIQKYFTMTSRKTNPIYTYMCVHVHLHSKRAIEYQYQPTY